MNRTFRLYFHAPCFDGVASAAIASAYLGSRGFAVEPEPAAYTGRKTWLAPKAEPFGVVDFLYHPGATFFADHHSTTFLESRLREEFHARSRASADLLFDPAAPSCASLLVRELAARFDCSRYASLAQAATTVDSAAYASVDEAVFPVNAAGMIRDSLAISADEQFLRFLVRVFLTSTPEEVAKHPEVRDRVARYELRQRRALDQFRKTVRRGPSGVVLFDYDLSAGSVSRYAPYLYAPEADYSVGITRFAKRAKITAMRNPWRDFPSVPLGRIFERFGGGGHTRVASLELAGAAAATASETLEQIVREIVLPAAVAEATKC